MQAPGFLSMLGAVFSLLPPVCDIGVEDQGESEDLMPSDPCQRLGIPVHILGESSFRKESVVCEISKLAPEGVPELVSQASLSATSQHRHSFGLMKPI